MSKEEGGGAHIALNSSALNCKLQGFEVWMMDVSGSDGNMCSAKGAMAVA